MDFMVPDDCYTEEETETQNFLRLQKTCQVSILTWTLNRDGQARLGPEPNP